MKQRLRIDGGFGLVGLAATVLGVGGSACKPSGASEAGDGGETDVPRAIPVEVAPVEATTLRRMTVFYGEVKPSAQVNVLPKMSERVKAVHFEEGDRVEGPRAGEAEEPIEGQLLVELEGEMVATGIAQARSGLQAIGAQISGLRREQERLRKLVADGIVAPAQLDQISDQIRALQGQRGQIQAGREQAELAAGNTVVRSTLTGVVTRRMVEVGDLVSPMSPMAVIVSLDEVFVWIDVPEYELEGVRARETVEVTVESAPERVLAGRLDLVSPTVDRESRSVRVRYRVSNPDWLLRNGMVARVAVETERVEDVPAVPMAALSLDLTELGQEQTFTAFVERDGAAVARTVRIGMQAGARVEVRSGLAPGDRLIVQGHHLVQDGSPVEVVEPGNGHGRSGGAGSDSPDGGAGVEAR